MRVLKSRKDEAEVELNRIYPNPDYSMIKVRFDEWGQKFVSLIKGKGVEFPILLDGSVGKNSKGTKPSKTLLDQKNILNHQIEKLQGERDRLRAENERLQARNDEIEGNMTMRDKVKRIFKKYGSAVGVVIGVIVSNLKNGLSTVGKKVGNGLKDIGKKLGQILPRIIVQSRASYSKQRVRSLDFWVKMHGF